MVANWEQNLVHLLDSMVHHCKTVNGGNWMTMMGEGTGRRKKGGGYFWEDVLTLHVGSLFSSWTTAESNHTSFMVNILTFSNFLNQDKNLFISQTAANMLVNATDFKFSSKSTF
jgi:hypothetical protein